MSGFMSSHRSHRPFLSAEAVRGVLSRAMYEKKGFSFVRLGDGEGMVLACGPCPTEEETSYFQQHFGPGTDAPTILAAGVHLRQALASADLIGIRDDVWFADETLSELTGAEPDLAQRLRLGLSLRPAEKDIIDPFALRRLFGLYQWTRSELPHDASVCSSWVCYDLAHHGFWEDLLSRCGQLGLIHCSPGLPAKLSQRFGIEVEYIPVPDMWISRAHWSGDDGSEDIYPAAFERVSARLSRPLHGKLFLVGAGIFGKHFMAQVKNNGGVAIDVGALLDAWDGRSTRPLVYASKASDSDASHMPFMLREREGGRC